MELMAVKKNSDTISTLPFSVISVLFALDVIVVVVVSGADADADAAVFVQLLCRCFWSSMIFDSEQSGCFAMLSVVLCANQLRGVPVCCCWMLLVVAVGCWWCCLCS